MTLTSKTQRVLTSPIFLIPTVIVVVGLAELINLWRKNRSAECKVCGRLLSTPTAREQYEAMQAKLRRAQDAKPKVEAPHNKAESIRKAIQKERDNLDLLEMCLGFSNVREFSKGAVAKRR